MKKKISRIFMAAIMFVLVMAMNSFAATHPACEKGSTKNGITTTVREGKIFQFGINLDAPGIVKLKKGDSWDYSKTKSSVPGVVQIVKTYKKSVTFKGLKAGTGRLVFRSKKGVTATLKITVKGDLSKAKISNISNKVYTGKQITQAPKVVYNGKVLKKDVDYRLVYKNNKEPGTAAVYIKGKGMFFGTVKKTFKIKLEKTPKVELKKNVSTGVSESSNIGSIPDSGVNYGWNVSYGTSGNGGIGFSVGYSVSHSVN